jgi:parvulin-like peptidyl-prolyl isomerase
MFPHRKKFIWINLTLLTALGLSACASLSTPQTVSTPAATFTPAPPAATSEPLALSVNGEGITRAEFNAEAARYTASQTALGKTVASADAASAVIQDYISKMLLAQAAHTNGFTLDEAALQKRIDALTAQLGGADAFSKWESDHGYSDPEFRYALKRDAESAWMRDKIVSTVPSTAEQVHVQQILLYNQDKAQEFLAQLNSGADFNDLAFTADPVTRGDLGWVPRGYLLNTQIEDAVFGLDVGQHSGVIATDVGFQIVRILARDPNRPLSPDALLALQELALKKWIEEQRAKANVVLAPQ